MLIVNCIVNMAKNWRNNNLLTYQSHVLRKTQSKNAGDVSISCNDIIYSIISNLIRSMIFAFKH